MQTLALTLTPNGTKHGMSSVRDWLRSFDCVNVEENRTFVHMPLVGTVLVDDNEERIRLQVVAPDTLKANYIQGWFNERVATLAAGRFGRQNMHAVWQRPTTVPAALAG